jgi:hypothetical protein
MNILPGLIQFIIGRFYCSNILETDLSPYLHDTTLLRKNQVLYIIKRAPPLKCMPLQPSDKGSISGFVYS